MSNNVRQTLEILPMIIYLIACIACSAYFLYSSAGIYLAPDIVVSDIAGML